MPSFLSIVKPLVPKAIRQSVRDWQRETIFRRAMKEFLRDPGASCDTGNPVLGELIRGWGNEGWSALSEYLAGCVREALASSGPILECGSGLSTVLLGAVAKSTGRSYWALEHNREWAARVGQYAERYGLDVVKIVDAPLKDRGTFAWYDAPLQSMPSDFGLVICDGPPGSTKGGRYGLVPVMAGRFRDGCIILVDDASREPEKEMVRKWESEISASVELIGVEKPYFRMKINL